LKARKLPEDPKLTEARKIKLPISEAFRISLDNIRIRFTRAFLTMVSIILGIAFMVFLLMTASVFQIYGEISDVSAPIASYQYWLVFVSLLVCAVSISNSMLTAVYDRYMEIGTMKCLGALNRHILLLFLIESALLGTIGGILGFIFGGVSAVVVYSVQLGLDIVLKIPMYDLLFISGLSMVLSVGISIVATLYPALQAARLSPVEALKFEL
jgi:ABC-type antimicrobial peptide transport system permease subunit